MPIISLNGIKQLIFMMDTFFLLSNLPPQEGQVRTAWEPPKLEIFVFHPQNLASFIFAPPHPPPRSIMLQWVNIPTAL
jgi:hypothetical protein